MSLSLVSIFTMGIDPDFSELQTFVTCVFLYVLMTYSRLTFPNRCTNCNNRYSRPPIFRFSTLTDVHLDGSSRRAHSFQSLRMHLDSTYLLLSLNSRTFLQPPYSLAIG